jgi:hypothetical protein
MKCMERRCMLVYVEPFRFVWLSMSKFRTVWATTMVVIILAIVFVARWHADAVHTNRSMLDNAQDRWTAFRYGDTLERESRKLAGPSATDCGRAPFGGPLRVNACVLRAIKENSPFRARYVVLATDVRMETSLIRAAEGRAYEIIFMEGPYVPPEYRLSKRQCPEPLKLEATDQASIDGGRLSCLANPGQLK